VIVTVYVGVPAGTPGIVYPPSPFVTAVYCWPASPLTETFAPASEAEDQIGRLEVVDGMVKPYVLDISWEDVDGKTQFQRIPVGH
jgi:hypothetical protein